MVDQPQYGEILELSRTQLELSQRANLMLGELARLTDLPTVIAAQLAITHALHDIQRGLPVHLAPAGDLLGDHKRGSWDG